MSKIPKTAFLLCDLQTAFRSHIHHFPSVIKTSSKMIQASDILDIPLIVTEHYSKALGKTVSELDISRAALVKEKTRFSMLVEEVAQQLQGKENVVLFGIESHVCILQTALECRKIGKTVYVLADGISSCNKQEVPIAIKRMQDNGVIVTTSESILFELLQDASHVSFKRISALIKETKEDSRGVLEALL